MSDQTDKNIWLDGRAPPSAPDPHGEAALLLTESLIHGLLARSSVTLAEAIDIVQIATDVQVQISRDRRDDPSMTPPAVRLLSAIAESLRIDDRHADRAIDDAGDHPDGTFE